MIFNNGDVVYKMPVRFWEVKEPTRCIVKEPKETTGVCVPNLPTGDSVYVYSEEYGHEVYVSRETLFFLKESCEKAISLYSQLRDVYFKDEGDKVFERMFKGRLSNETNNDRNVL